MRRTLEGSDWVAYSHIVFKIKKIYIVEVALSGFLVYVHKAPFSLISVQLFGGWWPHYE